MDCIGNEVVQDGREDEIVGDGVGRELAEGGEEIPRFRGRWCED